MSDNRKIAQNTIIVYAQLLVTMIVNLLLSRLVLKVLGASDFGLYNVVGGVITLFTMLSASMSVTTTRFLNFEQGKLNGNINNVFNQSLVLHISISILVFLLLETLGLFYISNYLNVEAGKENEAMLVFQISTIVASIGVINVPFQSLFVVYEKFTFIAITEILVVLLRLICIIILLYIPENALIMYAIIMCLSTIFSMVVYLVFSLKRWGDVVKWNFSKDWKSYEKQLFFSNWNLLGTISITGRTQGSAMLINYFFGTTVNAAFALANAVLQQVNVLVGRFDVAVAPQLTQSLGANDDRRALYLTSHVCRLCMLLMEVVLISLFIELDFVLKVWLGNNVPAGTLVFCRYMLVIALVSATSSGLLQYINGKGNIKWFRIYVSIWYGLSLIIGFILYKLNFAPYTILVLFVVSDVLTRICQFLLLKRLYNFDVFIFAKEAYIRPLFLLLLFLAWYVIYSQFEIIYGYQKIIGIIITLILSVLLAFFVGLYSNEKKKVLEFVKKII